MPELNHLPSVEDLLPHRGTMLLLDRLISFESKSITSEYVPNEDAWYADEQGNMPSWIGIELMAQTVAAHAGVLKRAESAPLKQGVLLGTRRYTSTQPAFAAGETLRVQAKIIYRDTAGFVAYECGISVRGKEVANAMLKVFEPDDFQTFLLTNQL